MVSVGRPVAGQPDTLLVAAQLRGTAAAAAAAAVTSLAAAHRRAA